MFTKRIPLFYLFIVIGLGCVISFFLVKHEITAKDNGSTLTIKNDCERHIVRLGGYKFVNQLLYSEHECESDLLTNLKSKIFNYVEMQKSAGKITNASVYIRVFLDQSEWISINGKEQYYAASLMKLPVLMTFAHMAETNPGIMKQQVKFEGNVNMPQQYFPSKTLQKGQSYTVSELLQYMIAYSDNNALYSLFKIHDPVTYKKIFTDLELPFRESAADGPVTFSVKEYSVLLRVLYNGTYLSTKESEYVLSMLAQSDFKEGVVKGLPAGTVIAHKFGEHFDANESQLHESAIVYTHERNYIITVMTKGKNMKELSDVIGDISHIAYEHITTINP